MPQPSIASFLIKTPAKRPLPSSLPTGPIDLTDSPPAKRTKIAATASDDVVIVADSQAGRARSRSTSVFFPEAGPSRPSTSSFRKPEMVTATSVLAKKRDREGGKGGGKVEKYRMQGPGIIKSVGSSGSAFDDFRLATRDEPFPAPVLPEANEDDQLILQRHREWQRRLLGDGLIPRRRSLPLEEAAARAAMGMGEDGEGGEGMDEGDEEIQVIEPKKAAGPAKKGKKKVEVGPSGLPYTPLEMQVLQLKKDNPDVLLLVEVGYKFKFFDEDAKIASKELGIACFPQRNFFSASIPVHRLPIHVKKLVAQGHKVGVVRQTETAALKAAGDNRNNPFERKMTNLYTAATYVDDSSLDSSILLPSSLSSDSAPPPTNAFLVILDSPLPSSSTSDPKVLVSMLSVVASTGEVLWDEFESGALRNEMESRLAHTMPSEVLLPKSGLSKGTEGLVGHFAGISRTTSGSSIRVERATFLQDYDKAFEQVSRFYRSRRKGVQGDEVIEVEDEDEEMKEGEGVGVVEEDGEDRIGGLTDLPKQLTIALAAAIKHLRPFGLADALLHVGAFAKFSARAHMILSSNTLANLEIYRNNTEYAEKGSLMWVLNHTKTKMGQRLLREWVGRPLTNIRMLRERLDAVEEIINSNTLVLEKLKGLLKNMPDLQRGLCRIQYGKATPDEVVTLLISFQRLSTELNSNASSEVNTPLLKEIIESFPRIKECVQKYLNDVSVRDARSGTRENLFVDPDKFPSIQDAKDCISVCSIELEEHLKDVRKILKKPTLQYITVSGIEFLVEVRLKEKVPDDWVKISATKFVARYHTPDVIIKLKELEQSKETLAAESNAAFLMWQEEISESYDLLRDAVSKFATFDCLLSLATVASASGYVKPVFVDDNRLNIVAGRHPMVELLRNESYVPNDIDFSDSGKRVMIITGPNMAGKSSCVRATALILIMAQIGSFVPADKAELGMHDAIFTRMGASDELSRGQSTFMVELTETSEILRHATDKSLVICDELGRGTSTHDGTAIAYGVLDRLVTMGCNTLFITHFPRLAREMVDEYPSAVGNYHMSYEEMTGKDGTAEIVFLYKLIPGLAQRSFGIWVGKLAGLPQSILQKAEEQGDSMRDREKKDGVRKKIEGIARAVGVDGGGKWWEGVKELM